jgi:acyl-CoA synthetase (AMP-forming)/AMP-acid ligase II
MSVADAFRGSVARWGDRPFLCILPETAAAYGIEPGEITYAEAAQQVDRLQAGYAGAQGRVGLMLDNRPDFFLHWLALNAVGVSVVPLNPDLRPAELDYLIAHSGLAYAVVTPVHWAKMAAAVERAPHAVSLRPADESHAPNEWPPLTPALSLKGRGGSDIECALLYTSGTTGKPKGCVLSNGYFLRAGRWYIEAGGLCAIRPGVDRLITPLPMVHMNAMACSTMAMLLSGGCVIPLDRFHPRSWWDSVRESRASIVHYLGVMPSMLLGAPASPSDREHAVRFGFGAGVDRRHQAVFEERFGFPLLEAWAMTETGAGGCIIANHEPRRIGAACFGQPGPEVELRIVDESGADVPDGTPGELLVRAAGPDPRAGFFTEYLHDPDATAEAWAGGWFHTGDVIQREPGGDLLFVDRRKNVIRRSGENISAVEVESVLRRHPAVADVAVAPTPDPVRGEEVLACIVPRGPTSPELAAEIVVAALQDLSYFKVPGWVAFVDALPLTATNKIQRGELKALAATLPGTPGCIDTRGEKSRARQLA